MENANKQLNIDVSQKVLGEIKKRKVKITDRWVFWAKKLGLGSGLVLANLIIIIIINLLFYYLQKNGGLNYLSFGLPAVGLILNNLPFGIIFIGIVLFILNKYLLNKTDLIYQKYYRTIVVLLILITFAAGLFLYFSGINKTMEKLVAKSQNNIFLLSEIYQGQIPCLPADRGGIIGKVIERKEKTMTIQTLDQKKTVLISAPTENLSGFKIGENIVAIGTGGDSIFVANKVRAVTPEMIKQCFNQIIK
jgi:hypothetical protein